MFGLTDQEAETVQTDSVLAVETLVTRPLHRLAATGRRIVLLVDALDEAQERGTNRVVRLLADLGKAKTNALSLVVTMRPDHQRSANLQILKSAYGSAHVLQVEPSELRVAPSDLRSFSSTDASASSEGCLSVAPAWAVEIQANEYSKIFVTVCRGFVNTWCANRPVAALPTPPTNIDTAYR